jgi:hypothetical protein
MTTQSPPTLQHVAHVHATILMPENIASTHSGTRELIAITGGTLEGEIAGTIIPGGADWAVNHGDGTATIWARYAVRRADGSLIMETNSGVAAEQPDGRWRGHTTPQLEAGADDLQWLKTAVLVGTLHAKADGTGVEMDWYRVV